VSMFKQWRPDFIWMDMRMPVKDGYQATAEIRQLPGGDDVAIVALTASVLNKESEKIIDSGCDDVIHKPYTSSKILEQMHKYLGVRYTYNDNVDQNAGNTFSVSRDRLMKLPESLVKTLHEVALGLNRDDFLSAVDPVRDIDQDMADGLAKLAKEFKFDKILYIFPDSMNKDRF
ncbi:MAG: response regulator, partial [Candidatus Thiodiazotropha sp.]